MGSIGEPPSEPIMAQYRFGIPDNSGPITDRAMYAVPPSEKFDVIMPIHDVRTKPVDYVEGAAGLDIQSFAYVKHKSVLAEGERWSERDAIEKYYLPEVEELVKKHTGATRVFCHNAGLRRKLVTAAQEAKDSKYFVKAGTGIDLLANHLPRDKCLVVGVGEAKASIEPARLLHVDYTRQGLADAVRYARKDIAAAAAAALKAEDEGRTGKDAPRYAAYGVWRPLAPVQRDPLAVCDWRTVDSSWDVHPGFNRVTSEVNENGEYHGELYTAAPPKKNEAGEYRQRWYFMKEQTNEDVLLLKFADSDPTKQAQHCIHGSPILLDSSDDAPPRESLEVRVLALFD